MPNGSRHLPDVAGPTDARPPFRFSAGMRVGFSDTDAQGIVYYGRYAPYFDIARVEYWRHLGFVVEGGDRRHGEFVMRAFSIEYHAPAVFDDVLEVFCRIAKVGNTSVTLAYDVVKVFADGRDQLLASATQTMVHVDLEARRPVPIGDDVRAVIREFEDFPDS